MKKERLTYYFSVEGYTEKWYLEWLQKSINASAESKYNVKFDIQIQKDPESRLKRMTIIDKTEITHIFDYESNSPEHETLFKKTLSKMKSAQNSGKKVKYKLGYSNFTFELWILLHKCNCVQSLNSRKNYLSLINDAFNTSFPSLDDFKHQKNFMKLLSNLN